MAGKGGHRTHTAAHASDDIMAQNLPLCLSGGQVGEWGIIFLVDGWMAVVPSHPHTVFQFHIENGPHVVTSEEGADVVGEKALYHLLSGGKGRWE